MRGIEKRFGAVAALRGIELEVASGQALAILGPNGAGKSTLLRILAGLARPTAGHCEIRLGDTALRPGRAAARARIGFAGHATLLYPELSARENLMFHGRLQGVRDPGSRADELLREEGLEDFADRRAGTFSRGMAQRLSIARARVQRPPLLLLDEPCCRDEPSGPRLLHNNFRCSRFTCGSSGLPESVYPWAGYFADHRLAAGWTSDSPAARPHRLDISGIVH